MPFRLLLRTLLFTLPVLAVIAGYFIWSGSLFPAPPITNNFGLNEKVALARVHAKEGVDVLALGSSMTLNNISSADVLAHFGPVRYLNLGSWGLGMKETAPLAPTFVDALHPREVLICTNLMDFTGGERVTESDSAAVARAFADAGPLCTYVRHHNLAYLHRQIQKNRVRLSDPYVHHTFILDACGAAPLHVPRDRITAQQIARTSPPDSTQERSYSALLRIAQHLHRRNIHLTILASPFRADLCTASTDSLQAQHVRRMERMLVPLGHTVINGNTLGLPDSLFADGSHLLAAGAARFTAGCLPPR